MKSYSCGSVNSAKGSGIPAAVLALELECSCVCTLSSCTSTGECCTSIQTRAMCYGWCSACQTDSCHLNSRQDDVPWIKMKSIFDVQRSPLASIHRVSH